MEKAFQQYFYYLYIIPATPAYTTTALQLAEDSSSTTTTPHDGHTSNPATTATVPQRRLPPNLIPVHYDLYLQLYIPFETLGDQPPRTELAFTTAGKTVIDFQCIKSTNQLVLHASQLAIKANKLSVSSPNHQQSLDIRKSWADEERQFYIIELTQNLTAGQGYRVELSYAGLIGDSNEGIFRSKYTLPGGKTR